MLPLFRAVLKFCSTNRLFKNIYIVLEDFYKKKLIRKWGLDGQNPKKILTILQGSVSKINYFVGQNLIFLHYYIQSVKEGIQFKHTG